MQVIRISNPLVFQHKAAQDFFSLAASENKCGDPVGVVKDIASAVGTPSFGCWVAIGEDGPEAALAVLLPLNSFMESPQILLIYSKNIEATKAIIEAGLAFLRTNGYNKAWGLNRSGATDGALEKLSAAHVGFARPIGSMMEYDF